MSLDFFNRGSVVGHWCFCASPGDYPWEFWGILALSPGPLRPVPGRRPLLVVHTFAVNEPVASVPWSAFFGPLRVGRPGRKGGGESEKPALSGTRPGGAVPDQPQVGPGKSGRPRGTRGCCCLTCLTLPHSCGVGGSWEQRVSTLVVVRLFTWSLLAKVHVTLSE